MLMTFPRMFSRLHLVSEWAGRFAWRPMPMAGVLACLLFATASTELAAQKQKPKEKEKSILVPDKTLTTADKKELHLSYYNKRASENTPVAVLLHAIGSNRMVWKHLAEQLYELDIAVITVDLRGHGQSTGGDRSVELRAVDYRNMVLQDLEAVKKFIFDEHQKKDLNMRKLAIITADSSAAVAIAFTEQDWSKLPYDDAATFAARTPKGQDVRALVLLSPASSAPGIPVGRSLLKLRSIRPGIAFWIGVGTGDTRDDGQAKKMYDQLTALKDNESRVELHAYNVKLRGTDLLGKKLGTEEQIVAFLNKHLVQLDDRWQDRRSRVARDS